MLDQLRVDDAKYQKALEEKRERQPIKMVTEVKGISRTEQIRSTLREDERFVDK